MMAFFAGLLGVGMAAAFYWFRVVDAAEVRTQFKPIYNFLVGKWWFDELYYYLFIKPAHILAGWFSFLDQQIIDRFINYLSAIVRKFSVFWAWFADGQIVDRIADGIASLTYRSGSTLRGLQRGNIRQYVLFIVIGLLALFVVISFCWNTTLASY